jgi:hypothetical protein
MTTTATNLADVPLPAGAEKVYEWEHPGHHRLPEPQRWFNGTTRVVEPERGDDIDVRVRARSMRTAASSVRSGDGAPRGCGGEGTGKAP